MSQAGENRLKDMIKPVLEPHFELYEEVSGVHLPDNARVRIDFILKAKPQLIEKGFTDKPIGLEVKAPEPGGSTSKPSQLAHQVLCYANSEFEGFGRPIFVLTFPGIEKHLKRHEGYLYAFQLLKNIMQKGHCGSLDSSMQNDVKVVKINFSGGCYWSSSDGMGAFRSIAERRWTGTKGNSRPVE
jgi:hypothetical protein